MGIFKKAAQPSSDENVSTIEKTATVPNTPKVPFLAIFLGLVASIGGFMFGYESGQISGMLTTMAKCEDSCCHGRLPNTTTRVWPPVLW